MFEQRASSHQDQWAWSNADVCQRKSGSGCLYAWVHLPHLKTASVCCSCRCCAFAPVSDNEQAVPRIYCGTQPADLIYSDDLGGSWSSCDLSEAPQTDSWFRRLPPYEPSVRAINFAASQPPASSAAAAAGASIDGQQQPDLLVAVEVSMRRQAYKHLLAWAARRTVALA